MFCNFYFSEMTHKCAFYWTIKTYLILSYLILFLTDKKEILNRWADHSNTILNRPSTISDEAI